MAKKEELYSLIEMENPDIIALSEILPKNSTLPIVEEYYNIDNYDRVISNINKGRGVVIYIKNSFHSQEITFETLYEESVWCSVKLNNNDTLLVGCVYRSPNSSETNNVNLFKLLREVSENRYSHKLIMGDFNFPEIDWLDQSTSVSETHIASRFLENIRDCYLYQHVHENTRYRTGQEPSLLDCIFTNEENMVDNIHCCSALGKSDHVVISFQFNCYISANTSISRKLNYAKGNYPEIIKEIQNIDWSAKFRFLSLSDSWEVFEALLVQLIEKFVPESKASQGGRKRNRVINKRSLDAIKEKRKKWKKYKYCKNADNWDRYKASRNKVTSEFRLARYEYEKGLASQIKGDNKQFWKYVRSKTKTVTKVNRLKVPDGTLTTNDRETANVLNEFFASVFEKEGDGDLPFFPEQQYAEELSTINISSENVKKC